MAKVQILLEGYASSDDGGRSCSTITLVQDRGLNIVIDPGTVRRKRLLLEALRENNLTPKEIDIVFITHSHIDHYKNVGIFPNAKVLDYWGWWKDDLFEDYHDPISSDIKIIKTPGHSDDLLTMLVKTNQGIVAICGDVFWKENYPEVDPFATDQKALKKSRGLIKSQADYIVPGHGKIYKVKK